MNDEDENNIGDSYRFELTPFRICPIDNAIIFFGYPLFGGWIPFIGWVTFYNKNDEPLQVFMIEWLLKGLAFVSKKDEDWYD